MKSTALIFTLLAGFAAAPAIQAQDAKSAAHETGDYMSDSAVTTKVKASLLTEKNLKSLGIDVQTSNGVVTLTGTVTSSAEVKQAEDVTRHVKGVKDVKNSLRLKTDTTGG
jgi:hyperosmotically inducible periplasmic protein